jgi:hypothetical protein
LVSDIKGGKPERKRPLGRPRRRWVDNIKMDLGEIGWDDVDWIDLTQDRDQWRALVNTVMYRRLGGPQERAGCYGGVENLLALPGVEYRFVGCTTRSLVATPTESSNLRNSLD